MGKRKQTSNKDLVEPSTPIRKRTRQESASTKVNSQDPEQPKSKRGTPSSSSTSTTDPPVVSGPINGTSADKTANKSKNDVNSTTTITALSTSTSTTTAPKPLPRIAIHPGLVPRQIPRSKVVKAISKTSTAAAKITGSSETKGGSSSRSVAVSSLSAEASSTTISTDTAVPESAKPVFRAKDIIKQWLPPLPESLPPTRKEKDTGTNARTTTMTTTKDTMIHAEPIIVFSEKFPNRREYPYGNYPSYYETRIEDQTKNAEALTKSAASSSSKSAKASSSTFKLPSVMAPNPSSLSSGGGGAATPASEQLFPGQRKMHQHRVWKETISVLFPHGQAPTDQSDAIAGGSATTSHSTMTLHELAKKIDIRFEFLDPSWFRGKRVLDIGCNSALLTVFIAVHYKPCKIQGVDIDPSLIGKAQSFILKTFSQLSERAYRQIGHHGADTQDGSASKDNVPYEEYFPRALHRIHGYLPVPPRTPETEKLFPHNIELRVADWVTEAENHQEKWDVILVFSITKWVHLHHGDAGLKAFFQKIYRSLAPGGIMLLEPQAFGTYNKRSKILPEMSEHFKNIQFKPPQFQEYLLGPDVGFKEAVLLGHSEGSAKNFNRNMFLYRK